MALGLGRHGDAARLIRLVIERPLMGDVYAEDEERPQAVASRVEAADPAAWAAAVAAPLLSAAEAGDLIHDVLTDPDLPPQAPLIDPYLAVAAGASGLEQTAEGAAATEAAAGEPASGPATAWEVLAAGGDRRRYRRGQHLFRQGQAGSAVHLVVAGWVAHQSTTPNGEVATLDVVGPGDLVGELSLLRPGDPRPTSAVALCPVEAVAFQPGELEALRQRHPAVQQLLVEHLLGQVRRLSGSLTDALNLPAETRVLRRLVDLCAVYAGPAGAGRERLTVPLTQDELATMAGTSRPTVNRALRQAEDAGHLHLGRGRIVVRDVDALCRAADLDAGYWMPWSRA